MRTNNVYSTSKTVAKVVTAALAGVLAVGGALYIPNSPLFRVTSEIVEIDGSGMTERATQIVESNPEQVIGEYPLGDSGIAPLKIPYGTGSKQEEAAPEQAPAEQVASEGTDIAERESVAPTTEPAAAEFPSDQQVEEQVEYYEYYEETPEVAEEWREVEEWQVPDEVQQTAETYGWVYPEIPAPIDGEGGMTGDELVMAHEIFDRYNEWRASRGLNTVTWDGACAEMAVNSAKGCSDNRKLIHRLGIPTEVQDRYSDILQYASWRKTADDSIASWENSDGHRKMMLCPTAQNGACGVYFENGIYWYAIVYSFQGTNLG